MSEFLSAATLVFRMPQATHNLAGGSGERPEGSAHSRVPAHALRFAFARSSGPGGQNVNKRSTKCLLRVEIAELALSPAQRERLVRLAGPSLVVRGDKAVADAEQSEDVEPEATTESRFAARATRTLGDASDARDERDETSAVQLLIVSDEHRSQERNRDAAIERLHELVLRCLVPPKQRRATKPSRAAKQRRLTAKKQRGERKRERRDGGE